MSNNFNLQFDSNNLLTYNGDGGDSANRTSIYLIIQSWENNSQSNWASNIFSFLTHPWFPGLHRRNPDLLMWYSNWDRMSRDQTIPLLIAFDEYKSYSYSFKYILGHILRLCLFTTNIEPNWVPYNSQHQLPDLTGPDFWSLEIRSLPLAFGILLYPLLCVLDLYNLGSAIFLRYFNKTQIDVINHVMFFMHAQRKLPTPFIWFSNKYINNVNDLQSRLDTFFGTDPLQPKFNEILKPWLIKYFQS